MNATLKRLIRHFGGGRSAREKGEPYPEKQVWSLSQEMWNLGWCYADMQKAYKAAEAERDAARADLARVTAERDAALKNRETP